MKEVTLSFECGCFVKYWVDNNRLQGGLSCCQKHEVAYQKLENILPLVLTNISSHMLSVTGV